MRDALQRQIGNQALACSGLLLREMEQTVCEVSHHTSASHGMVQRRADAESPN